MSALHTLSSVAASTPAPLSSLTFSGGARRTGGFILSLCLAAVTAVPLRAQETETRRWTLTDDVSKGTLSGGLKFKAGDTFETGVCSKASGRTGFPKVADYAAVKQRLEILSSKDHAFLQTMSPLPAYAGDPKTAGLDYLVCGSLPASLIMAGPYRSLKSYTSTIGLRITRMSIDVLSPAAAREGLWGNVRVPDGYFPERAADEFERRRQVATFLADVQKLKPLTFSKEIGFVIRRQLDGYDFTKKGFTFNLRTGSRPISHVLVRDQKVVSEVGVWPLDEAAAEKLLKENKGRTFELAAIVKSRPLGLMGGGQTAQNPTLALEPMSVTILLFNGDGYWKLLDANAPVASMFPASDTAAEVLTEFNEVLLEK